MAKVEMSLKEYDALKEELDLYKKTLKTLMEPRVDTWDLEWYHDHMESSITAKSVPMSEMPKEVQGLIRATILSNLTEDLENLGEIDVEHFSIDIFRVTHREEDSSEGEVYNDRE